MEACATSHYWSRQLQALGHSVKLMPPSYVKPYSAARKERNAEHERREREWKRQEQRAARAKARADLEKARVEFLERRLIAFEEAGRLDRFLGRLSAAA